MRRRFVVRCLFPVGFFACVLMSVWQPMGVASIAWAETAPCTGDCDGNATVTVAELLKMVNIALGVLPVGDCQAGDANSDGEITINEILSAVKYALEGCGSTDQANAETAPSVVLSTMQSIDILDFGYVSEDPTPTLQHSGGPRFRLAGTVRAAVAEASGQAGACPTVTCTVAGTVSTRSAVYTSCETVTAGHTIVRNGTVTQTVADRGFCATNEIPTGAMSTLTLTNFALTETDAVGAPLASVTAMITETLTPAEGQCGTLTSGTETIDGLESFRCTPGAQAVRCPAGGADLTLTARNLVLRRATDNGVPCTLTVTAQGELDIQNALTGERFDESFAQTQFGERATIDGHGTTLSVEGPLTVGCLGLLNLQTPRPIVMAANAACPSGGVLQLAQPVPGEPLQSSMARRAEVAVPATAVTSAEPVNAIDENDGLRQGVFRAANGQVYQVLQNVNAGADLGAEAFRVTSVVGSAGEVEACTRQTGYGFSGLAAVAVIGGQAIRSDLIRKSPLIQQDVSRRPCFSSAGDGRVCVGTDCGPRPECVCPSGGACETFSVGDGALITTRTDGAPAARFVGTLRTACQDLNGGATYAFGPSGPTTEAGTCQPALMDGFALSTGDSIIFAYQTPLATRFTVGYAGFPVDRDGQNPFKCPADTLVGAGPAIAHLTLPPPMIEFSRQGGIAFDFNQDGTADRTAASCQETEAQCVAATPLPTQTQTPAPPSPTSTPTGTPAPLTPTVTGTPLTPTPTGTRRPNPTPTPTGTPPPTPTVPLPDLIVTQLIAGVSSALPGQTIPVTVTVANQGTADAGPFAVTFVFSTDTTISPDDAQSTVACQFAGLAAQATATCSQPVIITATLLPGTYYLGAIADASGQVNESDVSNNTRAADTGRIRLTGSFWTTHGPRAVGSVFRLAIDPTHPQTLYAGTNGGVFKSTDGGGSWLPMNNGLNIPENVRGLAIDPIHPQTLYAGTDRGGVFKSTDGGARWRPMNNGLRTTELVLALAIDPTDPQTLYAGTFDDGVFKSSDGGASWVSMNNGLSDTETILTLAIEPTNPKTLYAGTFDGVSKSTDAGASWRLVNDGLSGALGGNAESVNVLTIDSTHPQTVYAGTHNDGAFESTDGGASWLPMNNGLHNPEDVFAVAMDPTQPQTLYAGTSDGVFNSTDDGASWRPRNNGLSGVSGGNPEGVNALAIDPTDPQTLYAGTYVDGAFKSTDGGASWRPMNNGLNNPELVNALAIDATHPQTLYAATNRDGIFKSADDGGSWLPRNNGLRVPEPIHALAIDPTHPQTLYAANNEGVFKSTDGGASWVHTSLLFVTSALVINPTHPQTLYAATNQGVLKSADGGTNWLPMNNGLNNAKYILALAIDPTHPQTLYAGPGTFVNPVLIGDGVFKSTDGGTSWLPMNNGLNTNEFVDALAIDPTHPQTLYAGTDLDGVFKSTDGGASWLPRNSGLSIPESVLALMIDPTHPQTLFAGTAFNGVFKSENGGMAWAPMSSGLTATLVDSLALAPTAPPTLYAATDGGVYAIQP